MKQIQISIIKLEENLLDTISIYNNYITGEQMNPFTMMKDAKNMEKMMKPALEKFMLESGFVKKDELIKLEKRIHFLEEQLKKIS